MKKSGHELRGTDAKSGRSERRPFGNAAQANQAAGPTAQSVLELKQQISALEVKLNKILDLLNPPMPSAKKNKKETAG